MYVMVYWLQEMDKVIRYPLLMVWDPAEKHPEKNIWYLSTMHIYIRAYEHSSPTYHSGR
jgi:hypothetical protein